MIARTLLLAAPVAAAPLALALPAAGVEFDAPVVITQGDETFKSFIYPTPVLLDIDGDDQRELVIGDLVGHLWTSEARSGSTEGGWTKAEKVRGADGKILKLNNW